MKRFLAPILLVTLLFPSLALGLEFDDLVERGGLFYEKFTNVPFTGEVTGQTQGELKDGKQEGPWAGYHDNGQVSEKGTYKDGKKDGPWISYNEDRTVDEKNSGTFKDGVKVE
jgi:hypothetical protein